MFEVLTQLKRLLTVRNLEYLDTVLRLLVEREGNPVYDAFWIRFQKHFPDPDAGGNAWNALRRLQRIVKQQLKEQR